MGLNHPGRPVPPPPCRTTFHLASGTLQRWLPPLTGISFQTPPSLPIHSCLCFSSKQTLIPQGSSPDPPGWTEPHMVTSHGAPLAFTMICNRIFVRSSASCLCFHVIPCLAVPLFALFSFAGSRPSTGPALSRHSVNCCEMEGWGGGPE